MFGSTVAVPIILAGPLCISNNTLALSEIISTIFCVSGIATLLQASIGNRFVIFLALKLRLMHIMRPKRAKLQGTIYS